MKFREVEAVPPIQQGKWSAVIDDFVAQGMEKAEVPLVDVLVAGDSNDENLVALRAAGMQRGVRVSKRRDSVFFELV